MRLIFLLLIFVTNSSFAQDKDISNEVAALKTELKKTTGLEKLKLLDQLEILTRFRVDYNYDSIANQTIEHAASLDSLRLVSEYIMNYIYHKNNIAGTPEKGIEVFNTYIPKTKGYNNKKWLSKVYIELADSYYFSGNLDSAFVYYKKTIAYGEASKYEFIQGLGKLYIGGAYADTGDFSNASKNLQESSKIFIKLKDTLNLISAKSSLSILYSQNNFLKEAEIERNEAIKLTKKIKNYGKLASFSYNAAADDKKRGAQKERIKHLKEAIAYSNKSEYEIFYRAPFYSELSIAFSENDSIIKAQEIIAQLEENPEELTGRNRIYYVDAVKNVAKARGELQKALSYGEESLTINKDKNAYEEVQNAALFLSQVHEKLGNKDRALAKFKEYTNIKDSITGVQKTNALAYYQTLYETEKRDNTIKAQKTDLELLAQKNKTRNQWFLFLGILTILGVTGFILYKNYKQKLQRRLAVEQLRTKISADLHDDVGSLLTGLSMQTELLARQVPEEQKYKLERVSQISKDAMLKMRDAVWAMDARKDNWQGLTDRMNEFAIENLETKDITYTLDVDNIELAKSMQGAVRQNLYLIFKEAIANVLKHSNATKVEVHIKKSRNNFIMHIADNGKTNEKLSKAGQGLTNMTLRATQLLGNLHYKSDNGFHITVNVPVS